MRNFSIAGLQLDLNYTNNADLICNSISQTSKRYPWVEMIVVSELAVGGSNRSIDYSLENYLNTFKSLAKQLNIWLIPIYGIKGAALATSVSYILDTCIKSVVFSIKNKVSILDIFLIKMSDFQLYKTEFLKLYKLIKR